MKLISWNVNGLRACVKKGFMDFFQNADFDVFCIQETKMQREQSEFDFGGLHQYWNDAEKKGYSGTAVFTHREPLSVTYDLGLEKHNNEGRAITLEFEDFYLVNVYVPNSQRDLVRLAYRMEWELDFRAYAQKLDDAKPVVICGDMNVAHTEIDIKNPKSNVKNPGFTPQEREKMTELLASGFLDTFRYLYPDRRDAYTWWSMMPSVRERNIGWRIDYFIVSARLAGRIEDALILDYVYGSDHCPVGLNLS